MEEEDQAVLSEVKIEMDVAEEPAEYWTTQQWTQGECYLKLKGNYMCKMWQWKKNFLE
jgi:hypothetical protein